MTITVAYKLSERGEFRPKLIAPLYPAVQSIYAKYLPSQVGQCKKKFLNTTATSKAMLTMLGYDGDNKNMRDFIKKGYHLPLDLVRVQQSKVDENLWLDKKYRLNTVRLRAVRRTNSTRIRKEKKFNELMQTAHNKNTSNGSKNTSNSLKQDLKQFSNFQKTLKNLITDPTFNPGCLTDQQIKNFVKNGPERMIFTMAGCDILRDEGVIFANRLKNIGGAELEMVVDEGMPHGYFSLAPVLGGIIGGYDVVVKNWLRSVDRIINC